MKPRFAIAFALVTFFTTVFAQAGPVTHPFICTDYNGGRVNVVAADGKIEWSYECKEPQDCWRLANGNYLSVT